MIPFFPSQPARRRENMQEVTHTLPTWEALRAHFGMKDPHSVVGMLVIREQQEGHLRLFTLRFFWKPEGRDMSFGHMLSRSDFQRVGAPLGLLRDLWSMSITEKPKPLQAGQLCWFLEAFLHLRPELFPSTSMPQPLSEKEMW